MGPPSESHHHRSTTKTSQKPFKSRFSSKGFIKDLSKGKIERAERGSRKTPHQQVMSKLARRNQANQSKQRRHEANAKASSVFSGQNGAPRTIAVIPLCEDNNSLLAVEKINHAVDIDVKPAAMGPIRVRVDRFKQNVVYVPVERDLLTALDACRVADFVVLLLSSTQDPDEEGETILRGIVSQGVSNILTVVQDLEQVESPKKRQQVFASLKSYISYFLPDQEKIHSLDLDRECINVIRILCTTVPKGIKWREDRSWMLVEKVQWPSEEDSTRIDEKVIITGVIRGKGLNANRLVQVGDWGSYQIDRITDASLPIAKKRCADDMVLDAGIEEEKVLALPDEDQDLQADIAPRVGLVDDEDDDMAMDEPQTEKRGVLLDDHRYFSDDESHLPEAPKRLPPGTSKYQSAWFLGDVSDSGSDAENEIDHEGDLAMNVAALPQDGLEGLDQATQADPDETTPSEAPASEMFLDPSPEDEAAQLAAFRVQRGREAEEDREFPDEVELRPDVLARERLAKYRGLKSLKSSRWDTHEDKAHEPEDWDRLLSVPDYNKAKSQATREALVGGVQPGTRVNVYLRYISHGVNQNYDATKPLALFSLLRHEQKKTVVNFAITLRSDYPEPLRSKDELILQYGSRRLIIHPLFSQMGTTRNDVHKFQRYLHPGETAMATFIAPLIWGPLPALIFKASDPDPAAHQEEEEEEEDIAPFPLTPPTRDPYSTTAPAVPQKTLRLIATGTSHPPSPSRIIAKRIILTGHPYKIHKRLVTVRYMFFNAKDVAWFRALPLWTRRGRSGFVKESLGTHGYFKATFDGRIGPQDAVGVSLYKRVWPRPAREWCVNKEGP